MTNPDNSSGRRPRRSLAEALSPWPIRVALLLLVLTVMVALYVINNITTGQRDATGAQSKALAEQVQATCAQGGDAAKKLGRLCSSAAVIASSPIVGKSTQIPVVTYRVTDTSTVTYIKVSPSPLPRHTVTNTLLIPTTQTATATSTETSTEVVTSSGETVTVTTTTTDAGATETKTATETTTEPGPTVTTPGPTTTVTTTPTCVIGVAC